MTTCSNTRLCSVVL